MDPVSLIVAALAAGAAGGVSGAATDAVTSAYKALKTQVSGWLTDNPGAELILAQHEADPNTWQAPLIKTLNDTGASEDSDLIAAARGLLTLTDPAGTRVGKYNVSVHNSQGTTIGDSANVTQHYGNPLQP